VTLPTVTRAQLEPLLERLLADGDNGSGPGAPLVLVRADPTAVPAGVTVAGRPVELVGTSSPLEIRARVSEPRSAPLVVLTGCDNEALGADLLARAVRRRLHAVDRWAAACALFGAEHPSRALAQRPELADALLEAKPVSGYARLATKVLDLDTALDNLVRWHLGLDVVGLPQVLAWAESPQAARALRVSGPQAEQIIEQLTDHVAAQVGEGARFAFAAAQAGRSDEVMPLALAASLVWAEPGTDPTPEQIRASVHLDTALGSPDLRADAYRQAGEAAVAGVQLGTVEQARASRWILRADQLVEQWKLTAEAWRSPVLGSGFTQCLARAAAAIEAWRAAPSPQAEAGAQAAVARAASHRQGLIEAHRVERLEMAARLVRRASAEVPLPGTLTEAVGAYTSEGAWLDRARVSVSRGDAEPTLAALCAQLTAEADAARLAQGPALARVVAGAAHDLAPGLTGIEAVLDTVVAPVVGAAPVLVVVLDGMGWPTFTEVLARLEEQGWTSVADPDGAAARPVVAALPTVTEVSRTSLLAGVLRSGDNASEKRALAAHPALVTASGAKSRPPKLFHKADFRQGGSDATTEAAISHIGDERNRVVGVVINNIDERLKDVTNPPQGWGINELTPLGELLDAARSAGRAVVLTADHGHVLERATELRSPGGGGERWRTVASGPAGDGEIEVRGPRVVTEGNAAVLPWAEQIRYAPLRNGYHGGLTLAEAVVPLAVLTTDDGPNWAPRPITPPKWWHPRIVTDHAAGPRPTASPDPAVATSSVPGDPSASGTSGARPRRTKPAPEILLLFEPPAAESAPANQTGAPVSTAASPRARGAADPIDRILAVDKISAALPALRLDAEVVGRFLRALDQTGGTAVSEQRVADAIGLNRSRIGRLTAQIQRLVNLDGYAVIESTPSGELRFHRTLLETQLGLN
jgi:PglZ domain